MKTVDQHLKNPSSTGSESRQGREWLTPRHERLLNALWQRMTQLFGHKWVSQEGDITNERGEHAHNFLHWARKTKDLTDAQWRRGMEHVEYMVREAARQGDSEVWPPSYAAFLGFCDPRPGSQMYREFEPLKLPDKTAQDRAKKKGAEVLDDLKSLLGCCTGADFSGAANESRRWV